MARRDSAFRLSDEFGYRLPHPVKKTMRRQDVVFIKDEIQKNILKP
jgi:hypothetical protein